VQFVGGIAVVGLVLYEYSRTTRPSTITSLYLLATVVGRSVQLRTLATRDYVPVLTGLLAASLGTQLFLLLLELWSKIPYLLPTEDPYGPEETAGVVNRTFFWWLNPLFLLGNRRILAYSDLTPLDHSFHAVRLQERMHKSWAKCKWIYQYAERAKLRTKHQSNTKAQLDLFMHTLTASNGNCCKPCFPAHV
jgi:ATP-binding cassette subfamily C (CFTR/MRP) protein 1